MSDTQTIELPSKEDREWKMLEDARITEAAQAARRMTDTEPDRLAGVGKIAEVHQSPVCAAMAIRAEMLIAGTLKDRPADLNNVEKK